MGHDFVTYHDRHVHLHDFTIWTLRHFSMLASTGHDELHEFFSSWQWIGPGVHLGTDLHDYTSNEPARVRELKAAIASARHKITEFGDEIPLSYLDEHLRTKTAWYTKPQPTGEILDAIDRINSMINDDSGTMNA